jgi:hypothetical protein
MFKAKLQNVKPIDNTSMYTYESRKNRSYLDYVLRDQSDKESKLEVKIEQLMLNTSDHLEISMIFRIGIIEGHKKIMKESEEIIKKEKNMNWQNTEARGKYEIKVLNELRKIKINTIWKEGDYIEERVEKAYCDLVSSFINAHNEVIKER